LSRTNKPLERKQFFSGDFLESHFENFLAPPRRCSATLPRKMQQGRTRKRRSAQPPIRLLYLLPYEEIDKKII
jgi:hypothetical protein